MWMVFPSLLEIWNSVFFVLMLLNVPLISYGCVGTVASDIMGLLTDIKMNDNPSPAI